MLRTIVATLFRYQNSVVIPSSAFSKVVRNKLAPSSYTTMKAFVKTHEGRAEIKFKYVDEAFGLDRWFTLNRSLDDTLQQIKDRLIVNIDKATMKHRKKLEKKLGSAPEFKVNIKFQNNCDELGAEVVFGDLLKKDNVKICVNGQVFSFDIDPPTIKTLKLPTSVMAGFSVYPSKLELENCHVNECLFTWYKSPPSLDGDPPSVDSESWIPVDTGLPYETTNSDIGNYLKLECTPKCSSRQGLTESIITPQVIEAGPGLCPFETRHTFTRERVDETG